MKQCADRQRWLSTLRRQVEDLHRTSGSNGPPDVIDRLSPSVRERWSPSCTENDRHKPRR
jgi:hypothetical protein